MIWPVTWIATQVSVDSSALRCEWRAVAVNAIQFNKQQLDWTISPPPPKKKECWSLIPNIKALTEYSKFPLVNDTFFIVAMLETFHFDDEWQSVKSEEEILPLARQVIKFCFCCCCTFLPYRIKQPGDGRRACSHHNKFNFCFSGHRRRTSVLRSHFCWGGKSQQGTNKDWKKFGS